ncbi:BQ5605_C009g05519 [Microbotryum silenes-dioicae]|uniref:BQ5605_C009g05519 protein n=1 Tax=Microbotryum silenes-dioicae TaxID=796604 RepID=A0A2X0PFH9_9BASI|nr:BQ5605_C009g05519 [Microbotryum silenes-dioicae]
MSFHQPLRNGFRWAKIAKSPHPQAPSRFRPPTQNPEFNDRLSYVRDVDEGKKLVARRLIRSSWSHDSVDCRKLLLDKVKKEHHNSLYTPAFKSLEELETVGPLPRLCSGSYKALVWLRVGNNFENLRAQYRKELAAFLEANPGFKAHNKRVRFTRTPKPKENNSRGRNGGARPKSRGAGRVTRPQAPGAQFLPSLGSARLDPTHRPGSR